MASPTLKSVFFSVKLPVGPPKFEPCAGRRFRRVLLFVGWEKVTGIIGGALTAVALSLVGTTLLVRSRRAKKLEKGDEEEDETIGTYGTHLTS